MSKSITLQLKTKDIVSWHTFSEDRPQLDSQFDDLSYHDGTVYNDALEDFWQVADDKGGGIIACIYEKNTLIVKADSGVSDDYFLEVTRFVISETAQSAYFKDAHVTNASVQGNIPCPSNARLADVCNSLIPAETTKKKPVQKRTPKP